MKPKLKYSIFLFLILLVLCFSHLSKKAAYDLGYSVAKTETYQPSNNLDNFELMENYKSRLIDYQLFDLLFKIFSGILLFFVFILLVSSFRANKSFNTDAASDAA